MPGARQDSSPGVCARVREWLPEYDYGGPGWWRRRQAARHLAQCPGCARELTALRRATALVEALPREVAPEGLWDRLEGALALERARPARSHSPRRRMPALAAAATAAVLAAGLGLRAAWQPEEPAVAVESYVQSHLALSRSRPLSPGAGYDAMVLLTAGTSAR
ncbi:MAG: zf-HC2 domain-containing protein [Armatimonadetes bacterium]|nr:zf-HC2 domain-containing protein [Armatimonadota bacterium]